LLHRVYSALQAALTLSKPHREALRRRGLSDTEIDHRGYRTLPIQGRARHANELRERLGNALLSVPGFVVKAGTGGRPYVTIAGAAGLLIPVRDPAGRIIALKSRSDNPGPNGCRYSYLSGVKYGGPGPGTPAHVPLGLQPPADVVRVTEGELKADVATALSGLHTIAAAAASSWRPALDLLPALGCKTVRLAFDADALDNPHVARALADCCQAATAAGLAVELEHWDRADGKGIDDLLAAGRAPELLVGEAALAAVREALAAATAGEPPPETDGLERLAEVLAAGGAPALFADQELLKALARLKAADPAAFASRRATLKGLVPLPDLDNALKPFIRAQARERPPALLAEAGYRIDQGRICRERMTLDGGMALVPLCNFTAQITEVVSRDDGAEQTALFSVAGATAGGRELPPVSVPAMDFAGLGWVTSAWHGEGVVYAGQGTRDHLRAAIELLSPDRQRRTVYTHTGWRRVGGTWVYLHGAGAIGPVGTVGGMEVSLPDSLVAFALPAPPDGEALAAAVRASLALLDGLVANRFAFPLLGAVFRAVLGEAPGPIDLSLHLAGPHGVGKSELAALAQQHFGAGLDARHLPGSWSSTANALEGLAFAAKDALLVVDDYAPRGAIADRQRLERDADRLLRAQGNRAGRQRMRPDGSQRPPKPPRGLILSTGEDVPPGQSLRGRMLVLEVSPGDVPLPRLTPHQRAAAAGLNAQVLAGFIRWLAPQYGELCRRLPDERSRLREKATTGMGSTRTPAVVADLVLGLRYFLRFAAEAGAITAAERDGLEQRGWMALVEAAAAHTSHVQSAEPAQLFVRLLVDALASGRAHVAGPDGAEPENPSAWGWRCVTIGTGYSEREEWQAQGRRVGWLEGPDLYLLPNAAFAEAQALAAQQGEALPVSARTLWRRLRERGLLASWDEVRQRYTVRRRLQGHDRREVLHLRQDALSTPDPPSPPSPDRAPPLQEAGELGDGRGDGCADTPLDRPQNRPQIDTDGTQRNAAGDGGDGRLQGEGPSAHSSHATPRRRRGTL
jgi:hypothetical protein